MQFKSSTEQQHIEWLIIAKGIGIILVVAGHYHPASSPAYWSGILKIIYSFHMPLFFILSGYLYSKRKYSYRELILNKTKRLLVPFVSISLLFFVIKYFAGHFVDLDHPASIDSLFALLINPINSFMPLLWFIHALFIIFIFYPLARLILSNPTILLLLLAINSFATGDYPLFGRALYYMPFFVTGVILREHLKLSGIIMRSEMLSCLYPAVLFIAVYAARVSFGIAPALDYFSRFLLGFAGSLFVINLSHTISELSNISMRKVLLPIGFYSMTIYLFHTLFESSVRIGFSQIFSGIRIPFELIAIIAIISGLIFPLILEKELLRRYRITRNYILGLS